MTPVPTYHFAIGGAGIIGLTLALELHSRGASVALLDTGASMGGASSAAAGMLAARDPHNRAELRELSSLSISLYDGFLALLSHLSAVDVPYQTNRTLQYQDNGTVLTLIEQSIDPRQLGAAALRAVRRSGITIREDCGKIAVSEDPRYVALKPLRGPEIRADQFIHASGAWFSGPPSISPRKGQMLRVQLPADMRLDTVHRSSSIYVVPRTQGPQAGTALIGATDEDAGFDARTCSADLDDLRQRASALIPVLGDKALVPEVEAWAGFRPVTIDGLPLIGRIPGSHRQWIAGGHYRNGVLLAPATAVLLADLLQGKAPAVDVKPFDPARLA